MEIEMASLSATQIAERQVIVCGSEFFNLLISWNRSQTFIVWSDLGHGSYAQQDVFTTDEPMGDFNQACSVASSYINQLYDQMATEDDYREYVANTALRAA